MEFSPSGGFIYCPYKEGRYFYRPYNHPTTCLAKEEGSLTRRKREIVWNFSGVPTLMFSSLIRPLKSSPNSKIYLAEIGQKVLLESIQVLTIIDRYFLIHQCYCIITFANCSLQIYRVKIILYICIFIIEYALHISKTIVFFFGFNNNFGNNFLKRVTKISFFRYFIINVITISFFFYYQNHDFFSMLLSFFLFFF